MSSKNGASFVRDPGHDISAKRLDTRALNEAIKAAGTSVHVCCGQAYGVPMERVPAMIEIHCPVHKHHVSFRRKET